MTAATRLSDPYTDALRTGRGTPFARARLGPRAPTAAAVGTGRRVSEKRQVDGRPFLALVPTPPLGTGHPVHRRPHPA
ncbi:hypothetical protein AB0467_10260 [Streptomyces sp. NPDC052095]|uniref:hypothetical protein n=1 Tax=unclassified Streptomyces TaxID=2593676 RepID=UPI00344FCE2B